MIIIFREGHYSNVIIGFRVDAYVFAQIITP